MYAARILFRAGYAPAGQLLFLACPSKSNQKEGHPNRRSLRECPALLAPPGGCATRTFRYAKPYSNRCSPTPPGRAALLGGSRGPESQRQWRINALCFLFLDLKSRQI